jgi:hypothetical protein
MDHTIGDFFFGHIFLLADLVLAGAGSDLYRCHSLPPGGQGPENPVTPPSCAFPRGAVHARLPSRPFQLGPYRGPLSMIMKSLLLIVSVSVSFCTRPYSRLYIRSSA